jgi:hypothetical protein
MYFHDDVYKELPERDLWQLLLLGHYAQNKIKGKYDDKNKPSPIYARGFCQDGRRVPTVRKFLHSKGLISFSWGTDDTFIPEEEACENLLSGSMKKPEFNTSGYTTKKKEYSYSKEETIPVTDLSQVYKEVDDLNAYEVIYVYLHQKDYDFKVFTTTTHYSGNRRNGFSNKKYDSYTLKLYPVSALDTMDEKTYTANSETFARNHAKEILTAAFDLKFRALHDDKEYMSLKEVTKRIWDVEDKMRLLRRTLKELKVLQRKAGGLGDKALQKKLMSTSASYIKRKAPLWLNSKDSEKKELSLLVCKGTALTLESTINR